MTAGPLAFDPIEEARGRWRPEVGDAMAGATSLMRAQQIVLAAVDGALRPFGLTFARYEGLVLLSFSRNGSLPLGKMGRRLMIHPTSVTNIGGHAFSDCTSLKSVTIPDSVVSIGDSAFWGCSNLTSVTIPGSVTSIGEDTFEGCTKLTSAKFQGNAPTMGGGVFKETKRDFTVHYHNGATGFTSPTWEGFPSVDSIPNRH